MFRSGVEGMFYVLEMCELVPIILRQNYRLPPRTEAAVRLRYAGILFEETDNAMEAETALDKGVSSWESGINLALLIPS